MVFFSFAITFLSVDIIKYFVGAPRPYFSQFLQQYQNHTIDKHQFNESKLSFPSGHSAYSMCLLSLMTVMFYQSWSYVQTIYYNQLSKTNLASDNPHCYYLSSLWYLLRKIPLLSILILFIPTYLAIYIALTRITDYKHFAIDIVTGMLIGIVCAYISYLTYRNETYFEFNYKLNKILNELNRKV